MLVCLSDQVGGKLVSLLISLSIKSDIELKIYPIIMKFIYILFFVFIAIVNAQEEVSQQIWGNIILGYPQSRNLYFELDFEPKTQLSGEQQWRNIDITPLIEYYPNSWIDITAETVIGNTKQSNNLNTFEVSPRIGIRFHLIQNFWFYAKTVERIPLKRLGLSTLIRYEYRSLWYFQEQQSEHQGRLRFRLESKFAINQNSLDKDKTFYIFADMEAYANIGKGITEAFSSKLRLRIGPAYRVSYSQRFELLFIYDLARNTIEEEASKDAFIVDFRYKLFFSK